jgi:hypothetical protein
MFGDPLHHKFTPPGVRPKGAFSNTPNATGWRMLKTEDLMNVPINAVELILTDKEAAFLMDVMESLAGPGPVLEVTNEDMEELASDIYDKLNGAIR